MTAEEKTIIAVEVGGSGLHCWDCPYARYPSCVLFGRPLEPCGQGGELFRCDACRKAGIMFREKTIKSEI